MVGFSIDPADSFERQTICNEVSPVSSGGVVFDVEVAVCTDLVWFVNCFHDHSDTAFIIWILSIITVQVSDSLLGCMLLLDPIFNKVLDLSNVHELNVINVSVLLSLYNHIWRDTLVTHGLWVRLMILASCIDFITDLRRREAIVTFNVTWMYSFAFQFLLFKKMVERNVGYI
jgi:hypothetical protein